MKIVVVNYANDKYKKAQEFNTLTALKKGKASEVFSYSDLNIDKKFYNEHSDILSISRGNGLWLWKPYLIKKSLERVNYGDIIFYVDSGAYFTNKIKKILNKVPDFNIICFYKGICSYYSCNSFN